MGRCIVKRGYMHSPSQMELQFAMLCYPCACLPYYYIAHGKHKDGMSISPYFGLGIMNT